VLVFLREIMIEHFTSQAKASSRACRSQTLA